MKRIYFIRITLILCLAFGVSLKTEAQNIVPDDVELAVLKDIYDNLGYSEWVNKANWPTTWPASPTLAEFSTCFGVIVSNGDITGLRFMSNNLKGTIPASIGNLKALTYLVLNFNRGIEGSIPPTFANLSVLKDLHISQCSLSGTIPPALFEIRTLNAVDLSDNKIEGIIPENIGNARSLYNFSLQNNQLTGPIPASITKLTLGYLVLYNNALTGTIPSAIGGMTSLVRLYLDRNQFTGPIPPGINSLSNLVDLNLSSNQLSGNIPNLGNLLKLQILGLGLNPLNSTTIPAWLGNLKELRHLALHGLGLTGSVLPSLGNLTKMVTLGLQDNQLTGSIPDFSGLINLTHLVLSNNKLTTMVNLPLATTIYLDNNELTAIPNFADHVKKPFLILALGNNKLDFSYLEPLIGKGIKTLTYAPQNNINDISNIIIPLSTPLNLTARPTGQFSTVTWEKLNADGTTWNVLSNDQDAGANTYTRTSLALSDLGTYRWKMTNTKVSGMTLQSEPIAVAQTFTAIWKDHTNVSESNGTLTKTSVPDWNSGANSKNVLPSGQDGWFEFTVSNTTNKYIIGFSGNDGSFNFNAMAQGVHITLGQYYTLESNTHTLMGNVSNGDVFRVSREGSNVKYYRNGVVVRTVSVNPNQNSRIKAVLNGGTTPVVQTSFNEELDVSKSITPVSFEGSGGGISLTVSGIPPYTYSWSSGETTSSINNKPVGGYTVTVKDAAGRQTTQTYYLGYATLWKDHTNVSESNGTLTKTSIPDWNSGANSRNVLASGQDGWFEFTVSNTTNKYIMGFSGNDGSFNFNAIAQGVHITMNQYYTLESDVHTLIGSVSNGDVFRVSREGSNIKYYRNGIVIRTVSVNPSQRIRIKAVLNGGTTPVVQTSFNGFHPLSFYAIASGVWTDPTIWSLSEGGSSGQLFPTDADIVYIKGYKITISNNITCANVNITTSNDNTGLKIDGSNAVLTVKGKIYIEGAGNTNAVESLVVSNNGKLDVLSP